MGRPLKFKSVKKLEEKINAYFDSCKDELILDEDGHAVTDKFGNPVFIQNPPTVAGLSKALGFEDRQSIYDYKGREEFSCTIKEALLRLEDYAEKHLYIGKATGAIFWLKNHGWKDKTITEATIKDYSLFSKRTEEKALDYANKNTRRSSKGDGK